MKKFIHFFSYLFHPLFIGMYGTLFFFLLESKWFHIQEIYFFLIQVLIISILIPVTLFYLLLSLGKITSFQIASINERKIPLLMNCFLFFILIKTSFTIDTMPPLFYFFMGAILASFVCMIGLFLNLKISLHLLGITSLTAFVIGMSLHLQTNMIGSIGFLFASIGFVASSRLLMKAHNTKELFLGFSAGVLTQVPLWVLWV